MSLPRIRGVPTTIENEQQAKALSVRVADAIEREPRYARLRNILLRIGGAQIVQMYEPNLLQILYRGRAMRGTSAHLRLGEPSACHENVCSHYRAEGFNNFRIWTGYALSKDGLWRQHSWGQLVGDDWVPQDRGRLIETTVKRVAYFGYQMTAQESEKFCNDNWQGVL